MISVSALRYFYPRPPRGGRPSALGRMMFALDFYPRPPRGGRRQHPHSCHHHHNISIHALREEGDKLPRSIIIYHLIFLSTPSARRATTAISVPTTGIEDFYPRPPRGGRLVEFCHYPEHEGHFYPRPPRGGRPCVDTSLCSRSYFYPRPPRGGRPTSRGSWAKQMKFLSTPSARRATQPKRWQIENFKFLSTPSARRATAGRNRNTFLQRNFYPRPPRGGRPGMIIKTGEIMRISIHALREEGDRQSSKEFITT